MGKFGIGARVQDRAGDTATIIGKRKGERQVRYDNPKFCQDGWLSKSYFTPLEVVANDNEVSACAPVFEKEYSVGDRVRFIRDNPNGGAEFGAAGQEAVVLRVYDNKSTTYGQQVELEDFGCGFPPDAPVSALELIPTPVVTPAFAKGDRALSQNGDYVTVDTDPDEVDHVWVSLGTTKWRTPVSWLSKWEPKVGDRVAGTKNACEYTVTAVNEDGTLDVSTPGSFNNVYDYRNKAVSLFQPLPVAEQPAAEPADTRADAGGGFKAGDRVRVVKNNRPDQKHLNEEIGKEFTITTADGPNDVGWSGATSENDYWWEESELELVSSAPTNPAIPIGSTVTFTATGRLSAINDNGHMQLTFPDLAPAQNSFALPAKYVAAA